MVARWPPLWHGRPMARHSSAAGGIFLFLGILAGLAVGIALGQPTLGAIVGTAAGALVAIAVWALDRRR